MVASSAIRMNIGKIATEFLLIASVLVVTTFFSYGQNNCQADKIYGEWKSIGSVGGYKNVIGNVDSLRKIINIHSHPIIYEFQMDGTYTYTRTGSTINQRRRYIQKDVYRFDEVWDNLEKTYFRLELV